jgi:hypothetical protein
MIISSFGVTVNTALLESLIVAEPLSSIFIKHEVEGVIFTGLQVYEVEDVLVSNVQAEPLFVEYDIRYVPVVPPAVHDKF